MTLGHLYDSAYIKHIPSSFTPSQLETYLKRIEFPTARHEIQPDLATLQTLMVLHTVAFPCDNTDMHYTQQHHMPVTPQELFDRLVVGSKGSYCFGFNGLFLGMLRGLGYRAFAAPGRVLIPTSDSDEEKIYTQLSHLVLLVQPHDAPHDRVTYLVDVGFGGTSPLRPILLADGSSDKPQVTNGGSGFAGGWVWGSYPPERHRVVPGAFAYSSLETEAGSGITPQRDWHLQVSHAAGTYDWKTLYTFTDKVEFLQRDIDAASLSVTTLPGTIFYQTIVCVRRFPVDLDPQYVSEEEVDGLEWIGKWTLDGKKATKRVGASVLEERTVDSERERLEVLRDVFRIDVLAEDARWIVGRVPELPVS